MNIFFFGDSICSGQGISLHRGWVPRISADIEELAASYHNSVTVINSSVNGDTTRLALQRMPYDVQSHGIDMIIIQFGLNDCNYWKTDRGVPRVIPRAFEANLEEIIERTKVFGARKILLNTNHPSVRTKRFSHAPVSYEENNRRYNAIIRKVAKKNHDVVLNDIERYFYSYFSRHRVKPEKAVLKDGLHLSLLGHDLYYQFLRPRILKNLKELLKARK